MDKNTPREDALATPPKPARVALNVLALCFVAVGVRPWPRREFYRIPEADLGKFRLGPRAGRLGLFADRAGRRPRRAADRPAVRPFGAASGLFARTIAARRRVPGRSPFAISLAVPAEPRALRRHRHRLHRQRPELDPARPLVRPAVADRDGRGLFGHRRGRPDPAAGIADPDRPYRLARRLSGLRHRLAAPAGAAIAVAVAAVLDRLAASGQEVPPPISSTKAGRSSARCATTPSGRCSRPSSSPPSACTRFRRRSWPI